MKRIVSAVLLCLSLLLAPAGVGGSAVPAKPVACHVHPLSGEFPYCPICGLMGLATGRRQLNNQVKTLIEYKCGAGHTWWRQED